MCHNLYSRFISIPVIDLQHDKLQSQLDFGNTVLLLFKLTNFAVSVRFRCGCGILTFCLYFIMFAMFKNVVHSLEPGETPSNYVQRS